MTRLPELRERLEDMPHPSEGLGAEVEELTRSVPKLIGVLSDALRDRSDVRHKAALAEMISGLTSRLDQLRPLSVSLIIIASSCLTYEDACRTIAWVSASYRQCR